MSGKREPSAEPDFLAALRTAAPEHHRAQLAAQGLNALPEATCHELVHLLLPFYNQIVLERRKT